MPFLDRPFLYDMFVSFDHGRDKKLLDWAQILIDELEKEILDLNTDMTDISVVKSHRSSREAPLVAQFVNQVGSSGVVFIIMSEGFLDSDWCGSDAGWFETEVNSSISTGGQVIVLSSEPTAEANWPDCLKSLSASRLVNVRFYPDLDHSDFGSSARPFGYPTPLPDDPEYLEGLTGLSTVVIDRLRKIKSRSKLLRSRQRKTNVAPPAAQPNIYLHAPAHESAKWSETKEILEGAGCRVYPEKPVEVGDDLRDIERAREQRLRLLNEEAHAACALRTGPNVEAELQLLASDRTALRVIGKDIPCALIDRIGDGQSIAERLGIETVHAAETNWTDSFRHWLNRVIAPERRP